MTQPLKKLERVIRRLADVETRIRAAETPRDRHDLVSGAQRALGARKFLLAFDVGLAVTAT